MGAVGMDFGVRAVLVLWFCSQYPGFLAWVFLIHLTLILGGVLETFVPHWINLCRKLVCFPMVVTVPKYLPLVLPFCGNIVLRTFLDASVSKSSLLDQKFNQKPNLT